MTVVQNVFLILILFPLLVGVAVALFEINKGISSNPKKRDSTINDFTNDLMKKTFDTPKNHFSSLDTQLADATKELLNRKLDFKRTYVSKDKIKHYEIHYQRITFLVETTPSTLHFSLSHNPDGRGRIHLSFDYDFIESVLTVGEVDKRLKRTKDFIIERVLADFIPLHDKEMASSNNANENAGKKNTDWLNRTYLSDKDSYSFDETTIKSSNEEKEVGGNIEEPVVFILRKENKVIDDLLLQIQIIENDLEEDFDSLSIEHQHRFNTLLDDIQSLLNLYYFSKTPHESFDKHVIEGLSIALEKFNELKEALNRIDECKIKHRVSVMKQR